MIVVGLWLSSGGVAFAADPLDILNDYLPDGRLDGPYTRAELETYLTDEEIDMWADAPQLDALVQRLLDSDDGRHEFFPYTGMPVALVVFASTGLMGAGLGLRWVAAAAPDGRRASSS